MESLKFVQNLKRYPINIYIGNLKETISEFQVTSNRYVSQTCHNRYTEVRETI